MSFPINRRLLLAATALLALPLPAAAAQEALTFAWSPAPQTPQVNVALEADAFEAAGLDVSVVSFPSGREAMEALLGGQADLATMAEFPAVTAALREQDFAVIASLARYEGSRIIAKASSGIEAAADLAEKRVGVTLGTNTDFFLRKVLEEAGVEVEIVNAAPADLVPALMRGDVDAIAPFPNVYTAARNALGDDYAEIRPDLYESHFVLAASRTAIEEKGEALSAFLGVLVEADQTVSADPEGAAETVARDLQGSVDVDGLTQIWADTDVALALSPDLLELMVEEGGWIVGQGVVNADIPDAETMRPYLDGGPLSAVAPDAVTLP